LQILNTAQAAFQLFQLTAKTSDLPFRHFIDAAICQSGFEFTQSFDGLLYCLEIGQHTA